MFINITNEELSLLQEALQCAIQNAEDVLRQLPTTKVAGM